jgi:hypothetical protein
MAATMRESWTDERLDDFRDDVNRRFDKVDAEIKQLRSETNQRFDRVESRIDALQRTIIISNAAIFAAVLGVFATQL